MNKLYFEELDTLDQEKIIEILFNCERFWPSDAHLRNTAPETLRKIKQYIMFNNEKRTKVEWFSWITTEASKPGYFNNN